MPHFQIEKNATSVPEFTEVGKYPLYYIASDNGLICPDCVNSNLDLCRDKSNDQWFIVAQEVNWESQLYCEACSTDILSAYSLDDEDEYEDSEPCAPHDSSDDAQALASAGFGTDEDYGCWDGTGDEW